MYIRIFLFLYAQMRVKYSVFLIQIFAKEMNFRLWYETFFDLMKAEDKDQFPPRFKIKLNCHNPLDSTMLDLQCNISCIKANGHIDRYSLNIFVLGSSKAFKKGLI